MVCANSQNVSEWPRQMQRKTVLVVEDNEQICKLFALYLRQAGYRAEIARTGEEALKKATHDQPAAIILDLILPVMDGWEVLAQLKASSATRHIPVIITSVLDPIVLSFQLGAVAHLLKPVDRDNLLRALECCKQHKKFAGKRPKIMLAHDDPQELDALTQMLLHAGYEVIPALGGAEGIHLAKSSKPDLIVLDLFLSEVDYGDVVAALDKDPATKDIPVRVLVSQRLTPVQKARLKGKVDYIVIKEAAKKEALLTAVEEVLQEGKALRGRDDT